MKHFFLALLILLLMPSSVVLAQVVRQPGYVRTVGRPNNPKGSPLGGVLLRVRGQHNEVRSKADGNFSLSFTGKRQGVDAFVFTSVRLDGYELQEKEMLGRQHPLSSTIPVELVMVPQALKREIEGKVRRTIEAQYQKKLRRIQALREKDAARFQQEMQQLEAEYEKRDQLINDMVERYASTDYAHLDSLSSHINQYIEAGELERADSLINAQDLARLESEHASLVARTNQLRSDLSHSEKATVSATDQLMSLYKGKVEIHSAKFENDSAAMYWEKIVALDTTNVDNALLAGKFISEYKADYDNALNLYQMALRNAVEQYGEQHPKVATCYNNIGLLYKDKGLPSYSLGFYQKALDIQLRTLGDNHVDVAITYNNMGLSYDSQDNIHEALICFQKALDIELHILGSKHHFVAITYGNIGHVYFRNGNSSKALEYFKKALDIQLLAFGEKHPDVALSYSRIGMAYAYDGNNSKALDYSQKALDIRLQVFGYIHPKVAMSYNNIGGIYSYMGDSSKALNYYHKALDILIHFL